MTWFVYIVECADGSYYTGIAQDLERRINEHNKSNTIGSKYTRTRRPVKLVYQINRFNRSDALKEEARIKKLTKEAKKQLILSS